MPRCIVVCFLDFSDRDTVERVSPHDEETWLERTIERWQRLAMQVFLSNLEFPRLVSQVDSLASDSTGSWSHRMTERGHPGRHPNETTRWTAGHSAERCRDLSGRRASHRRNKGPRPPLRQGRELPADLRHSTRPATWYARSLNSCLVGWNKLRWAEVWSGNGDQERSRQRKAYSAVSLK